MRNAQFFQTPNRVQPHPTLSIFNPSATGPADEKISELNNNPDVHGILLQHPVPSQIDERACFDAIDLSKDVDGVTCLGFGRMAMQEEAYGSATPQGIMRLLEAYDIELQGKHAVVVGRSPILGKPMALMLLNANATVTVCHSRTQNLEEICRSADILVAAVGRPKMVKGDWIKPGAIVIGNIHYDDIELEQGANLAGRLISTKDDAAS